MTSLRQFFAMLCVATFSLTATAAFAQSGGKPAEPPPKAATTEPAVKDAAGQKKIDEIAEATTALQGLPAIRNASGSAAVSSTCSGATISTPPSAISTFTTVFGCPGAHIQGHFPLPRASGKHRSQGAGDLNGRVHACWINPGLEPVAADATPAPAATSGGTAKP